MLMDFYQHLSESIKVIDPSRTGTNLSTSIKLMKSDAVLSATSFLDEGD